MNSADVGHLVLKHVAQSAGVLLEQFDDVLGFDVLGDHQDGSARPLKSDLPSGLKALSRLRGWHADVGQDDVGP